MDLETIFSVCGVLAMLGWVGLVLLPHNRWAVDWGARLVIPGLIGLVYLVLMVTNLGSTPDNGGFGSLAEVKALFSVDALLLGGWVHYLAFDLFVGSWEVIDSRLRRIPHWAVIPCLLLTFMAGPIGLLLYLGLRALFELGSPTAEQSASGGAI